MDKTTKFTITCEMEDRWVPHFLGMLKKMEYLGNIGASREITFYADGDGDYRPKFKWDKKLPEPARAVDEDPKRKSPPDDGYFFDAG